MNIFVNSQHVSPSTVKSSNLPLLAVEEAQGVLDLSPRWIVSLVQIGFSFKDSTGVVACFLCCGFLFVFGVKKLRFNASDPVSHKAVLGLGQVVMRNIEAPKYLIFHDIEDSFDLGTETACCGGSAGCLADARSSDVGF